MKKWYYEVKIKFCGIHEDESLQKARKNIMSIFHDEYGITLEDHEIVLIRDDLRRKALDIRAQNI